MNVFYLHCAFVWTMEGVAGYFILVAFYNNTFLLPVVSYGLLYQTESCPSEAVEFICSNTDGPVVVWRIASSSGVLMTISFHSLLDIQGVRRSATFDNSVVNATLLYGNSSWYLNSLTIPYTLSSDIECNSEFLQYHSSNGK